MNPEQQYQPTQPSAAPSGNPYGTPPAQPAYVPTPQSPQPLAPQGDQFSGHDGVPAPHPSMGPGNSGHNPYEFIFAEKAQVQSGNGTLRRVLMIVGGLVILAIIAAIAVSFLTPKENSTEKLTAIVQEQQEIVRVADLADKSAVGVDLKNLAVNVSLSVATDATSLQKYLTTRNVKLSDAVLAGKQDAKTDALFAAAKSTNTFDHTAAQTLQSLLVSYRSSLNTTYQEVKGTNARKELKNSYQSADTLIGQANKVLE